VPSKVPPKGLPEPYGESTPYAAPERLLGIIDTVSRG